MKNQKTNFRIINIALFSVIIAGIYSCSGTTTPVENPKKEVEEYNDKKFNDENAQKDAAFIMSAAEIHLEEIKLGQLAQQNSTTNAVKNMGKMMEESHTKLYNELAVLAQNKIVTIPTEMNENGTAFYNKMTDKKGKEFDKEYSAIMTEDHKNAVALFENAASTSRDPEVKLYASNALPALQQHLNAAMANNK